MMKIKVFTLTISLFLFTATTFAQNKVQLKSLLNKNREFIFPQTVDKIAQALNVKTVFYEDANDEKYAKWITRSGLELYSNYQADKSVHEIFFDIPEDKFLVVEGLPFDLAINKTTLKEALLKFSRHDVKEEKLDAGSSFPGGTRLTMKTGTHFTTLLFDNKNLLKFMGLTTSLIDPAAN
ncbi:hypothetical protein [Sphingobacterium sp.]|uniref:hypothetical protein n=1 Tax=Sphingobacterium sp. TaxID=341027 RepID=UPI00289A6DF6|nr:hypothetical protein [Sphingobacterium sp.]